MGKRGNEHGQTRKEEYDALMESSSDAPKGPFQKASEDVLKKRRIVRSSKKFSQANKSSTPGTAGKGAFASVNLTSTPSNPFGGFSFGSSTPAAAPAAKKPSFSFGSSTPAATTAAPKPSFPSFAMPAASNTTSSKPSVSVASNGGKDDEKLIKCAQEWCKQMKDLSKVDMACYEQFLKTMSELSGTVKATTKAVATSKATTSSAGSTWDSSRPLFGGSKPLTSPTAGSAPAPAPTTNLFGASSPSPAPAAGGFSFNPTKPATIAAPVPAFSFSTTQSDAVKEAAKTAAVETAAKKPEAAADDEKKEEDSGELEAANDDYEVLYKTKTKILHVSKNAYIKGVLKLEKNRENGKNRLIVRDAISGRVKMNSAVSKGMPVSKGLAPATKKKGPTPMVIIKAVFDEKSKEPEQFKIITSTEEHENLFNELTKLV